MDSQGSGRAPSQSTLITLVLGLLGWCVGLLPIGDNSFLWHWRTSQWVAEHGVPRTELFSFSAQGVPWIDFNWLAHELFGWIDRLFGAGGLRVLTAATGALIAMLAYQLALRLCRRRFLAAGLTIAALLSSSMLWSPRPLLGLVAGFVALVWIVERPESWIGRRPLLSIPLLMWVCGNWHGSFALQFVYLALHLLGSWLDGRPPWRPGRERTLLLASLASAALICANPYGWQMLWAPFHLLGRGQILQGVREWQSPNLRDDVGLCFALWIAVFLWVALRGARERWSRRDVLVASAFLLLGLWAQRNIVLAPLIMLPIVARRSRAEAPQADIRPAIHWSFLAVLLLLAVGATRSALALPHFALATYPQKALAQLESQGLLGTRLVTTDHWGGFLIGVAWPRQHVFVDDRYETYPESVLRDFTVLFTGGAGWDEVLDRNRIEVVLWPPDDALSLLVAQSPAWTETYRDEQAVIFKRTTAQ